MEGNHHFLSAEKEKKEILEYRYDYFALLSRKKML